MPFQILAKGDVAMPGPINRSVVGKPKPTKRKGPKKAKPKKKR
jgi:hypothetical protein